MSTKFSQLPNGGLIQVGSQVVGLSSTTVDTIWDFPGAGIRDSSGAILVGWVPASPGPAVNYIQLESAITAEAPAITAQGADADIELFLSSKGTADIYLSSRGSVDIDSTAALNIASGTTAERPISPELGAFRYNTDTSNIEYYNGAWISPSAGGTVNSVIGTFNRITSTGGTNPQIDISTNYVGQPSITTLGTIGTGTWVAGIINSTYGGTGINNAGSTLTLGGSLSTVGGFTSSFTMIGTTNVIFPTSGILLTSASLANYALLNATNSFGFNIQYQEQLKDYTESVNPLGNVTGATTFNLTLGNVISATAVGNTTITVSNVPVSGQCSSISLIATNFGAYTITWMPGIVWTGGGAPTLQVSGTDVLVFFTINNGATWYGYLSGAPASAGTVTSVTGTLNRISVLTGTTTPVINIDPAYVGQATITTLGTVTSGIWNSTAVSVPFGGTGNTTFTAYSLICAGTLATNPFQNVAGVGTTGQILTSNGAGALPTWQTGAAGSVTSVNAGTNITITGPSSAPIVNLSATYTGQTTITTLGTVTTGTWNATPITVPYGGTGDTSFTAYSVVCGGTTTTGVLQNVSGVGTSGQVLTSNGAAALPTWQNTVSPANLAYTNVTNSFGFNVQYQEQLKDYSETVNALGSITGATTVDLTLGNVITATATGNVTFTITNVPSSGTSASFTMIATNFGAFTITWPTGTNWPNGVTPTLVVSGVSTVVFNTVNGGATWYAFYPGQTVGTVTSVASGVGLSGGPITTTGTLNVVINSMCTGRLTLTSGVPVTAGDVVAATTIYFTPYKGNYITLYTAGAWQLYTFSQMSLAVPSTTATMYDMFLYDSGGGILALYTVGWTNVTTRASAVVLQNGVYVLSGSPQYRYLGSYKTTSVSGQTEDSIVNRYVWNYYNRTSKSMVVTASTSWTYSVNTIRQANASATNQLNFIVGIVEDSVACSLAAGALTGASNRFAVVLIGLNSITAASSMSTFGEVYLTTATATQQVTAEFSGLPAVGYNYLAWLESAPSGQLINYGNVNTSTQSGINGAVMC